jgi:hypothetical protein
MITTREEWRAEWKSLKAERKRVRKMFAKADVGEARYEDADSAGFDLNERLADLAYAANQIFKAEEKEHDAGLEDDLRLIRKFNDDEEETP